MVILKPLLAAACLFALLLQPQRVAASTGDNYNDWLQSLEQDAVSEGITPAVVHEALDNVVPIEAIVSLDQKQPETTVTFDSYAQKIVSTDRIEQGRDFLRRYSDLLAAISSQYGVPAEIIVALWGIESNFGRNSGKYQIVDSLVTLAYEGRRAAFFRKELFSALKILDTEALPSASLVGSWAGAMGQCQFMPSTYLNYAVHYQGVPGASAMSAAPNIWDNTADVLASIANYLSSEGWRPEAGWGREIHLTQGHDIDEVGLSHKKSFAEWSNLGATSMDGTPLMPPYAEASLIQPDGAEGRSFLVSDSYRAIMRWNRSTYFATAVGLLADRIRE